MLHFPEYFQKYSKLKFFCCLKIENDVNHLKIAYGVKGYSYKTGGLTNAGHGRHAEVLDIIIW